MEHSFDAEIAKEYGVQEAIVLRYLQGQIQHNYGNDVHYHDGRYWTYGSKKSFCVVFPYMTYEQIKRIIKKLIDLGLVVSGNFNETRMDRRLWYALTDYGLTRCPLVLKQQCNGEKTTMQCGETNNAMVEKQQCVTAGKTDIFRTEMDDFKTDFDSECKKTKERENKEERTKEEIKEKEKNNINNNNINNTNNINNKLINDNNIYINNRRFIPPTLDEVRAYCIERKNQVDPEAFFNFYESKGWMVGKNKMKDFKAAVRTWERTSRNKGSTSKQNNFNNFQGRNLDVDALEEILVKGKVREDERI